MSVPVDLASMAPFVATSSTGTSVHVLSDTLVSTVRQVH